MLILQILTIDSNGDARLFHDVDTTGRLISMGNARCGRRKQSSFLPTVGFFFFASNANTLCD